jgi:hypothetical protein
VLRRQLADDLDVAVHAAGGAGPAGRADDERDPALAGGTEQQLQVVLLPFAGVHVGVGTQEVRPAVAAAGVGSEEVEWPLDPLEEGVAMDRLVTQRTRRGERGHHSWHDVLPVDRRPIDAPAVRIQLFTSRPAAR